MEAIQINNDIIKVDGLLNDSEWKNAIFSKGFFQKNPNNGEPSTEKTEVGVIYDDKNIYNLLIKKKILSGSTAMIVAQKK